jgi:TolA-binding protein
VLAWLWGCVIWVGAQTPAPAPAPSPAEAQRFDVAVKAFKDGQYEFAEQRLAEFSLEFPRSGRLPEAILLRARAALRQQRLAAAAGLLRTNLVRAGRWAEDYEYWLAETQMQSADFQAAAESFALLTRDYTNSTRLLEAGYGEALARYKLKQWDRVIQLLEPADGQFQKAAKLRSADELVGRGALLLAEAHLEKQQYQQAEAALQSLADRDLTPEYKWRREYVRCRILIASRRFDAALANITNLLALGAATGQPAFLAESVAVQGGLWEQLWRWGEAARAYEQNLAESAPAERRAQARLKIIQLTLATNNTRGAAQKLEAFFTQQPGEKSSDLFLLTLGELYLRQHLEGADTNRADRAASPAPGAGAPPGTNWLALALAQFDKLLTNYPQSSLVGNAQLDKGWCLWIDDKVREAQLAFRLAVDRLPPAADQAIARFKLGDTLFVLQDYTNALQQYRAVLKDYSNVPAVQENLLVPALYQIVHLGVEMDDLAGATGALQQILSLDTEQRFSDRGLLLVGQKLIAAGQPAEARAILAGFTQRFGDRSALGPQAELAIARSYLQEKNWPAALARYEGWLKRYATNELRPRVEFNFAWVNYQAGRESNAFNLFTNFLARYPTHELAPRAQYWVGDFYYRQNDSVALTLAESTYQRLYQNTNWAATPLAYQARLMAARAAIARQAFGQAEGYLTNLLNSTGLREDLAAEIVPEALFMLGDVYLFQDGDPNQPVKKFIDAREAFYKIPQNYTNSPLVPAAWGMMAQCSLQWAQAQAQEKNPKLYDSAAEAFLKVLSFTNADIAVRSQAEVGLGLVRERQAQLTPAPANAELWKSARTHYLNVLYGKNLNVNNQEKASLFWQKEAGLAAASLAEQLKDWSSALSIYKRLISLAPPLGPFLEKKLEKAREQARLGKG